MEVKPKTLLEINHEDYKIIINGECRKNIYVDKSRSYFFIESKIRKNKTSLYYNSTVVYEPLLFKSRWEHKVDKKALQLKNEAFSVVESLIKNQKLTENMNELKIGETKDKFKKQNRDNIMTLCVSCNSITHTYLSSCTRCGKSKKYDFIFELDNYSRKRLLKILEEIINN